MDQLTPPPELYGRIINQIQYEQQLLRMKRRLVFYGLLLATSLSVFVLAFKNFFVQASQSGFLQLVRLLTTDFHLITTNFSDYLLSVAEALPAISLILVGTVLLSALFSIIKLVNYLLKIKHLRIN